VPAEVATSALEASAWTVALLVATNSESGAVFSDGWPALGSMDVIGGDVGGGCEAIAGAEAAAGTLALALGVIVEAPITLAGGRGSNFAGTGRADFVADGVASFSGTEVTCGAVGDVMLDACDIVGASYLAPNRSPQRMRDLPNSRR